MRQEQIEELYAAKRDQLLKKYTFACNGSEMDAEDIVQETFARLLTYKESLPEDPVESLKYVSRIAHNCFLQNRNEQRRAGTVDYDELAEAELMTEEDKHLSEINDVIKHLDKVLVSYPQREQESMRLHFLKKYRCSDLAVLLGGSKRYWSELSNEVYGRLKAAQERGAYFTRGEWVGD